MATKDQIYEADPGLYTAQEVGSMIKRAEDVAYTRGWNDCVSEQPKRIGYTPTNIHIEKQEPESVRVLIIPDPRVRS